MTNRTPTERLGSVAPNIALCYYAEPEGDTAMKCTWAANVQRPPWMMKPKKGPTALIIEETCEKCEAFDG